MERNPVSVLMEHAQDSHVEAEFRVLISLGTSHQPRFLCQWVFNKTPFPAWFSSSKKDGKQKAALLTLEGLRLRPTSPRVFVFFVSDGLPTIYVERSSAADIDPRYFMGEPFTSTVEAVAYGEQDNKVMNYEPGKNELKPRPPKPLPRTPPKAADNAPKKMQAFDDDTIAALANRNGAFITNISCVTPMQSNPHEPNKSQQPATLPQPFRPPAMRQSLRIAPFQRAAASYSQAVVAPSQRAAATNGLATIAHQDDADTNGLSNEETDLSLDLTDALTSLKDKPIMSSVVTQQAPLPLTTSSVDLTRNQGQNPISALYELGQKKGIRPDFSVLSESGPPHQRTFVCKCSFGAYEETVHASSKNAGRHDSFKAVFEMVQNETPLTNGATPTAETSSENSGDGAEKNPISAVMELGNKLNILPEFECRQLSMTPLSRFEGYCVFGQRKFGPVVEQNKKRAKTAAFEKAWEFLTNDPFTTTELAHHQHSIVNSLDENSSLNVVLPPLNIPNGRGSPVDTESMQQLLSNKHPISAFLEYAQARHYKAEFVEVSDSGPAHCRRFEYRCVMNGENFPIASARTKKEARKHAAELALRSLAGTVTPPQLPDQSSLEVPNHLRSTASRADSLPTGAASLCDSVLEHVMWEFSRLKSSCSVDLGKVVLAGFVMEDSSQGTFSVISIGTGNKCLTGQNLSTRGTSINDCHAEVIARRGLLRYLYKQVEDHKTAPSETIFKRKPDEKGRLVVKSSLKFHLYISTAPCGDGALFTHSEMDIDISSHSMDSVHKPVPAEGSQGCLRSKMEVGEGTIPTNDAPRQTFDGISGGDRLKTMSCSDKICKWNVLGVQGTLLSDFIEPIYISAVVIGQLFHAGHLSRALCCRVDAVRETLQAAESVFDLHHVKLGTPSQTLPRSTAKSKPVSLNWMRYDKEVELLTAETGQVISAVSQPHSGVRDRSLLMSRLCKKRLYDLYNNLKGIKESPPFYSDAKCQVGHYHKAKDILYKEFKTRNFGNWLQKPVEQGHFR